MITRVVLIAALIVVPLAASADIISSAMTSVYPQYDLVLDYKEDRLVLDHDMSVDDCVAALPRDDPWHHVSYSCIIHK